MEKGEIDDESCMRRSSRRLVVPSDGPTSNSSVDVNSGGEPVGAVDGSDGRARMGAADNHYASTDETRRTVTSEGIAAAVDRSTSMVVSKSPPSYKNGVLSQDPTEASEVAQDGMVADAGCLPSSGSSSLSASRGTKTTANKSAVKASTASPRFLSDLGDGDVAAGGTGATYMHVSLLVYFVFLRLFQIYSCACTDNLVTVSDS